MEDAVGLSRLSFWPKIKVSCANEEASSFVFIAGEAAEPQRCTRQSTPRCEEIKEKSLGPGHSLPK